MEVIYVLQILIGAVALLMSHGLVTKKLWVILVGVVRLTGQNSIANVIRVAESSGSVEKTSKDAEINADKTLSAQPKTISN